MKKARELVCLTSATVLLCVLPQVCCGNPASQGESAQDEQEDPSFKKFQAFLSGAKEQLGRSPHWVDLYQFANQNGVDLFKSMKPMNAATIIDQMKEGHQDLPIEKEQLFSILKAQRQAIRTFSVTANILRQFENASKPAHLPSEETRRYTTADSRFLVEGDSDPEEEGVDGYYLLTSSDGIQRMVGRKPESQPGEKRRQPATIQKIDQDVALNFYFQPGNIVSDAMLVDSERYGTAKQFGAVDIMHKEKSAFVLEGKHDINGSECVCLQTPIATYYLDIAHGFALCRCERLPRMHVTEVEFIIEAGDFVDCGDGIWLPSKVSKTWFNAENPGAVDVREEIEYSDIAINEPIPPETFTDIIPDGAFVTDYTKNICYISNEKGEIAQFVSKAIPDGPPTAPMRRSKSILVILNGLTAALVVVYLLYRKVKLSGSNR